MAPTTSSSGRALEDNRLLCQKLFYFLDRGARIRVNGGFVCVSEEVQSDVEGDMFANIY